MALFSTGMAGKGGLATLLRGTDCVPCLSGRSLGLEVDRSRRGRSLGLELDLSRNGRSLDCACACLLLSWRFCGNGESPGAGFDSVGVVFWRFSI